MKCEQVFLKNRRYIFGVRNIKQRTAIQKSGISLRFCNSAFCFTLNMKKKVIDSDWLRPVRFKRNTGLKKKVTPAQITHQKS